MKRKIIVTIEIQDDELADKVVVAHGGGVLAKMKGLPAEEDTFERDDELGEDEDFLASETAGSNTEVSGRKFSEPFAKEILRLYKKGMKRCVIQSLLKINGHNYTLLREICDEYDRQR